MYNDLFYFFIIISHNPLKFTFPIICTVVLQYWWNQKWACYVRIGVYEWTHHISLCSVSVSAFILELWTYHLFKIFRYIKMSSGYKKLRHMSCIAVQMWLIHCTNHKTPLKIDRGLVLPRILFSLRFGFTCHLIPCGRWDWTLCVSCLHVNR